MRLLPSAVSIMLERLWPRLIPRTTALEGRSTLGPLETAAAAVTSGGGVLFSERAGEEVKEEQRSISNRPTAEPVPERIHLAATMALLCAFPKKKAAVERLTNVTLRQHVGHCCSLRLLVLLIVALVLGLVLRLVLRLRLVQGLVLRLVLRLGLRLRLGLSVGQRG